MLSAMGVEVLRKEREWLVLMGISVLENNNITVVFLWNAFSVFVLLNKYPHCHILFC